MGSLFNKCLAFLYRHLYVAWGAIVVGSVTVLTGAATAAIIGCTVGIALVSIFSKYNGGS